jgi:N,N'-diacetyllegionaminate synthase
MSLTSEKLTKLISEKGCIIIAEACDNHFGSLDRAKKMISSAANAGADIIKFQHHIASEEMLPDVPRSDNFKGESLFEFLEKYALSLEDHVELIEECEKNNIYYLCTPFSLAAAKELHQIGQTVFKIGSGEFLDHWYLDRLSLFCDTIIISTGMAELSEVEFGINYLNNLFNNIIMLNCTSEYPPIYEDINLGNIKLFQKNFPDVIIGHSDHTPDLFTSFAAMAMGAKVIEKHFYIDKEITGPDSDVSISPDELTALCDGRDKIIAASGKEKKVNNAEKVIREWAYRSVVVVRSMQAGEIIKESDIVTKRPATGIPSHKYKKVLGKRLIKNIGKNTTLTWENLDEIAVR